MFCVNCGKEISGNARFCKYCGTPAVAPEVTPGTGEPAAQRIGTPAPQGAGDPPAQGAEGPAMQRIGAPAPQRTEEPVRQKPVYRNMAIPEEPVKPAMPAKNRKILILVLVICAAAAIGVGAFFGIRSSRAQKVYDEIGTIGFSDESILTAEEQDTLYDLRAEKESAYQKKDVRALRGVQEEWDEFRAPLEDLIDTYVNAKWDFFDEAGKAMLTEEERMQCETLEEAVESAYQARDKEALDAACAEWEEFCTPIRNVMNIYQEISQYTYSEAEMSLLSEETLMRMQELQGDTESAFAERDEEWMNTLVDEWSTFRSETEYELEEARNRLLQNWVDDANATGAFTDLFSFGLTNTSSWVEGHTIVVSTQYTTDLGISDRDIADSLDNYLSMMSGTFQSGADYLRQYIEDVCIRVEYKNADGEVVSSREFR